ncbi:hypothetical protein VTI74DRAFT_2015 [Chaetomium olivicolor]
MTMSVVLDISFQTRHGPPIHRVLKLYDRRFGTCLRDILEEKPAPYTQENEAAFQAFVGRGMMPGFLRYLKKRNETEQFAVAAWQFLDEPDRTEGLAKYEAALWHDCIEHFECETKAYNRLADLQGKLVPRMLAHQIIQSAADAAHEINKRGIIMNDCAPRNVVVDGQSNTPRIIDLAQCRFRDELVKRWYKHGWHEDEGWDPDVEYWEQPRQMQAYWVPFYPHLASSNVLRYNFSSLERISPYLEPTESGPSSQWARNTAQYYSSLFVINKVGDQLVNYRKSFLYTDATWVREGPGFYGGMLGSWERVAMGVCMDIKRNPYNFEAPWDAYEFAFHVLKVPANLAILSAPWLTNDAQTVFTSDPDAPDFHTLTHWLRRLTPVIAVGSSEETIVVFANRCVVEDEATYAGRSTVMGIKDGVVSLCGPLGRGVEELRVVDTDKSPLVRFVDSPEAPADGEPGTPSAEPEQEAEERSSQGPSRSPGSGGADSPTLPAADPAPPMGRTHTQPPGSIIWNPDSSQPCTLAPDDSSPTYTHNPNVSHNPPSTIPILVVVYTPDKATWQAAGQHSEYRLSDGGLNISLSLSPWSSVSSRSAASWPRTTTSILIAASPSILDEGGLLSSMGCDAIEVW